MTFLLITKPEVRSVKLLGSWDNFSKQYVMERDTRAGPGHWKGCHTFTDMIGDGPDKTQWRTGGLKMGGTYWYYYLLDDDIEYYNEAEPTTTVCPLLPGQPMNVLNVPIILPDSRAHGRSASGSSQKSDNLRTMNPEDKFMNPRKPPPQPQPSAAKRVPHTLRVDLRWPEYTEVYLSRTVPLARATRKIHVLCLPPRARALLAAFRQPAEADRKFEPVQPVNTSKIVPQQNDVVEHRRNIPGIKVNAGIAIPSSSSADRPGPSTIQSRRAMKATPGESTPGRLLTVQTRPEPRKLSPSRSANGNTAEFDENRAIREALKDIASSSELPTPTAGFTKEKRLPTLPNTPSSVMDEAVRAIDERDKAMDGEIPRSYFSSMTATTIDTTHSRFVPEYSRFSEWSTDTETDYNPHESMTSASASDQHQDESSAERWRTPDLSQSGDASGELPPWSVNLPELTVSLSTPDIDCSGLGIDNVDEVESNPKRHAALFSALESMEALAMSRSPIGSPILLPPSP
ncbi:hypothetical protein N7519_001357 [Penicillium mononematosum]|uniref:uncharacterized protein n=1 Tax=Penicillium mononematosum TaxID=268346 RepID=UPI002546BAAF|nr:uncharacterized protein N7519_001357 [Penicillium mononematosum]KAJ6191336.1 hypothetical protein N7519_001357 [Penicillium mononematosum]